MQAAALRTRAVGTVSWTGRILSTIGVAFMIFDGVIHVTKPAAVVQAFAQLGFPVRLSVGIGIVELLSTMLYVIPRTSVLGALLLTGYLGGAIATQVRAGSGWFESIFPVLVAAILWGGLALRDARVRALASL